MDYKKLDKDELLELLHDLNEAILADGGRKSRLVLDLQAHQVELEMQNRELMETQDQLKEAVHMYSDLYDFAPVGYMTLDRVGQIVRLNLTAAEILTIKRQHATSIPFISFLEKEETRRFHSFLRECCSSGKKASAEFRLTHKKRQPLHVHLLAAPYDEGEGTFFRVCLMDITELRAAEEKNEALRRELLLAQRMDLAGRLSGGLIHDFNNIMTVISVYAGLASRESTDSACASHLASIKSSSGKALAMLRQLHILNGSMSGVPEAFNMNEVIPDAASLVSKVGAPTSAIAITLSDETPQIECARSSFEQLLLNILFLSRQYASAEGGIFISTGKIAVDGRVFASLTVSLSVGKGQDLDRKLREALLQYPAQPSLPNTSLKAVRSITENIGAKVEINAANEKLDLVFHIPGVQVAEKAEKKPHVPESGSSQKVLLVEDEGRLRKSIALVLSKNGYSVFEAEDAAEAEAIFRKEEGRFDLLLTDLALKGENGLVLNERLRAINPGLHVLFTSGCLDIETEWPELRRDRTQFIQKPFEIDDLLNAMVRCLLSPAADH